MAKDCYQKIQLYYMLNYECRALDKTVTRARPTTTCPYWVNCVNAHKMGLPTRKQLLWLQRLLWRLKKSQLVQFKSYFYFWTLSSKKCISYFNLSFKKKDSLWFLKAIKRFIVQNRSLSSAIYLADIFSNLTENFVICTI